MSNTGSDTDTYPEFVCPKTSDSDCANKQLSEAIPLLFSLDKTQIENAHIYGVATNTRGGFERGIYTVAIAGSGSYNQESLPFLPVFSTDDTTRYTVNWLTGEKAESLHGVRYDEEKEKWTALACGTSCFLVSSSANAITEDPLSRASGIDMLENFQVNAVARSEIPARFVALGDGIARLEENGSWNVLAATEKGQLYRAGHVINSAAFVAVGDDGLISVVEGDDIDGISSGITDSLTSVWGRKYLNNTGMIVYAFGENGNAYLSEANGTGQICPFTKNIIATLEGNGTVSAFTSDGSIYAFSRSVYQWNQCLTGSFAGPIVDAQVSRCGAGATLIGWSAKEVYAHKEAKCYIAK